MFGILNLNKPSGWTSRDVVNRVGRLAGRKIKCGHAGTLDPLATGVLLVCVGKATRLVPYIHEFRKSYVGTFQLGQSSDTDDVEGELKPVPIPDSLDEIQLRRHLGEFVGEIEQVPPAYSAVKIRGERAYKAARRGEDVELAPRKVHVHELKLTHYDGQSFDLTMSCGTGTYVRSIGRDLAQRVGTAAVMSALVRTSIGPFFIQDALDLDTLNADNLAEHLQPALLALGSRDRYTASKDEIRKLTWGQRITATGPTKSNTPHAVDAHDTDSIVVVDEHHQLVALARRQATFLVPQQVFV